MARAAATENDADCRGKLFVDPVVQLMQQHAFITKQ
jgi:hypothetical protein